MTKKYAEMTPEQRERYKAYRRAKYHEYRAKMTPEQIAEVNARARDNYRFYRSRRWIIS